MVLFSSRLWHSSCNSLIKKSCCSFSTVGQGGTRHETPNHPPRRPAARAAGRVQASAGGRARGRTAGDPGQPAGRARGHRLRRLHRPDRRRQFGGHPRRASPATWSRCRSRKGAEVKKGDLLFEIDPRPYQAQLDQAAGPGQPLPGASSKLAKATLARDQAARQDARRRQPPATRPGPGGGGRGRGRASRPSQASLEVYKLNLDFTKVTSPIDGQVSRYYLTLGNLVNQDQTLLTTVVSLDPMYVYFDMDEPTLLRVRRAINEGKIKRAPARARSRCCMGLQGEDGFPHQGTINFINNQVNPTTGSISVRGVFANPKPANGVRAAVAGHVRAHPAADRPAAPGAAGHRPGHRLGPGAEVRLRGRRREQGPVPPRHDRGAAGRRPARDRRAG